MDPKTRALRIIRNEHATLTAVIEALRIVTTGMAKSTLAPDFKLLWSIIYYIEEYPELLHHPKEEKVLFPALRRCTDALNETLDELGRQHVGSLPHLDRIKTLLGRVEADIPGTQAQLADKVESYAAFHWQRLSLVQSSHSGDFYAVHARANFCRLRSNTVEFIPPRKVTLRTSSFHIRHKPVLTLVIPNQGQ